MKKSAIYILFIVSGFLFANLSSCSEEKPKENISCEQASVILQKYKNDGNFVIIDFRPLEKFKTAHIAGAIYYDVFLPEVDRWLDKLDKSKTYFIYCTIGHRSSIALGKMKKLNFKKVYHLFEGIRKWQELGYKVETGQ